MLMENMKPGKPLEIFVDREGYRYRLLSKVEGVKAGRVYISLIASGSRVFRFLNSDYIEFIYKEGERMWKWSGVKGGLATLDGENVHYLESLKEGETYNRRDSFRVKLGAEHTFTKVVPKLKKREDAPNDEDLSNEDYDFIQVPCVLKDLSETGVGIYTNDRMDVDTIIELKIATREGIMKMVGHVVRTESGDFGKYREFYGCCFTQVDRNLSRYLFALQRMQLKKERGE